MPGPSYFEFNGRLRCRQVEDVVYKTPGNHNLRCGPARRLRMSRADDLMDPSNARLARAARAPASRATAALTEGTRNDLRLAPLFA